MREKPRMVLMGAILGAHGLRGEVKVKSFAAAPEAVVDYGALWDAEGRRRFALALTGGRGARPDILIARVEGCAGRDEAEALKGQQLFLPREALPQVAAAEEYYLADLIGLAVEDRDGRRLGRVLAAANHGAGDILEIAGGAVGAFAVPFSRPFVPVVDLEGGRIVVDLPADFFLPPPAERKAAP